jgi:hypothetical protein
MEDLFKQRISDTEVKWQEIRDRILDEFGSETGKGLDTQRVERFVFDTGLPMKPYFFVEESELDHLKMISDQYWGDHLRGSTMGMYHPELDMIGVKRDPMKEVLNGTAFTESLLVHEQVHSSNIYRHLRLYGRNPVVSRHGFSLPYNDEEWGYMVEEGFASMLQARYFAQNVLTRDFKELNNYLGYSKLDVESQLILFNHKLGKCLPLPAKYMYRVDNNNISYLVSAVAGYIVELLCRNEPQLEDCLIAARSDISKLREVPKLFNSLSPGLYLELMKGGYDQDDFFRKLDLVIDRVCGGLGNVLNVSGELKDDWVRNVPGL